MSQIILLVASGAAIAVCLLKNMEGIEHIRHGDEAQWLSRLGLCGVQDLRSPSDAPSSDPDPDHVADTDTAEHGEEVRLDVSSESTPTPHVHLSDASDQEPLVDVAVLSDSGSQSLDDGAAASLHAPAHTASGWTVGLNCGSWISEANGLRPLMAQGCVLLMNVYWNVRRLSRSMQRALVDVLHVSVPARACVGDYLAAALCGVSQSRVCRLYRWLRSNGWCPDRDAECAAVRECTLKPEVPLQAQLEESSASEQEHSPEIKAMMVFIREAISNAVHGHPDIDFVRAIARYRLCGVDVGQKYHSEQFAVSIENLARNAVGALTKDELDRPLAALGIPSDVAIVFDGVSIGATHFSHHETLLVTGATFTCSRTGSLRARLLVAPSMGVSHKGADVRNTLFQALADAPLNCTHGWLRARVAVFGGDGAAVRGGEMARHKSSGAAELAWQALHPGVRLMCVDWDLFHRSDIAGLRAVKKVQMAKEIHDISQVIDSLFGVGSGRVILRGVAEVCDLPHRQVPHTSGVRKVVHFSRVTAGLIDNFTALHAGLQARLALTQGGDKIGSQTVGRLVAVGRRLTVVDFVAFLLLYHDVQSARMAPFAKLSETLSLEPVQVFGHIRDLLSKLAGQDMVDLQHMQIWLCVWVLVSPFLTLNELHRWWMATRCCQWARTYPTFMKHIFGILWKTQFQACRLIWQSDGGEVDSSQTRLLMPHCQCSSRELPPRNQQRRNVWVGNVREIRVAHPRIHRLVRVPEWVATSPHRAQDMLADKNSAHFNVRFHTVRVGQQRPLHLQGVSLFGRGCGSVIYLRQVPERCKPHVSVPLRRQAFEYKCVFFYVPLVA